MNDGDSGIHLDRAGPHSPDGAGLRGDLPGVQRGDTSLPTQREAAAVAPPATPPEAGCDLPGDGNTPEV
jgi:hypothetical protein